MTTDAQDPQPTPTRRTPVPPDLQAKIRENGELFRRTIREQLEVELDYDAAGVEWTDGYINRIREGFDEQHRQGAVMVIASFLGECLVKQYDGRWNYVNGEMAVDCLAGEDVRIDAFPFSKVWKQFENGPEDSIASFYRVIPAWGQDWRTNDNAAG